MVNDFAQRSQSSVSDYNLSQASQSSTITRNVSSRVQSLNLPVPRLIVYRFVRVTNILDNPPNFSWLSCEGVSNYIVQLADSKGIVWRDKVPASKEQTVNYDSETFLEPGKDYIFTVEIDRQTSYVDTQVQQEVNIAEDVKKCIQKIERTGLPKQFKASLMAQLDGLLIAREEILDIIHKAVRQGSNSEIICFLNNFLHQGSVFELLANADSCDDILDALGDFATQLAAANRTLGDYLQLSGVQRSMAQSLVSKGADLAFCTQNLEGAFQLGQFSKPSLLTVCEACEQSIKDCIERGGSKHDCKDQVCSHSDCQGCSVCV